MGRRRDPEVEKESSFFGGVAVLTMGIVIVKLIGMFYKIPLGNIIGEQGNADFSNAYNIYAVLLTISTAGLPVAVSKLISEASTLDNETQVQRIFTVALKFFLFLGVISFGIMFFLADMLADAMRNTHAAPGIRALAPAVVVVSGVAAFRGYFQGRGKMTPTAVSQIIEALCKLIIGLALASTVMNLDFTLEHLEKFQPDTDITGWTELEIQEELDSVKASQAAAGAIWGVTIGTVMALAFLLFQYFVVQPRRRVRKGERADTELDIMKQLLAIAIPITITSSLSSILNLVDAALVQGQLQDALGYTENESRTIYGNYAYAVNIYNLPISLVTAVTVSVIPAVSAALAKKERKRGASIAISALRVTGLLAIPMGVGLFALGEPIVTLLYPNSDVVLAGKLLSTLGIVSSFVCLSLVSTSILQVYGFFQLPILISFVGGVIKVVLNFSLVGNENIGIYGAPIGYLCCFIFCFLFTFWILMRVVPGLSQNKMMFIAPTIAAGIMGAAVWAVYGLTERFCFISGLLLDETGEALSRGGGGLATILSIAIGAVIYFALVLAFGAVRKEDVLMMPKGEKLAQILPVR